MNVGNELAQIKFCKTLDTINEFLKNHNLKLDHWYIDTDTSQIYVVANYQNVNGVFIQMTFNY